MDATTTVAASTVSPADGSYAIPLQATVNYASASPSEGVYTGPITLAPGDRRIKVRG